MFAQRQNVVTAQRPGFSTNLYLSPVFDVPVHYDDVAAPVVAIFLNDREIIYQSASNPVFLWLPSPQGLLAVAPQRRMKALVLVAKRRVREAFAGLEDNDNWRKALQPWADRVHAARS